MTATTDDRLTRLRYVLLILTIAAVRELNVPGFFWEPLPTWLKIGVPLLLAAGHIKSVRTHWSLRVAGWIGVILFSLTILLIIGLSDDYIMKGRPDGLPNVPSAGAFIWRILLFLVTCVGLMMVYKRLTQAETVEPSSSEDRTGSGS